MPLYTIEEVKIAASYLKSGKSPDGIPAKAVKLVVETTSEAINRETQPIEEE